MEGKYGGLPEDPDEPGEPDEGKSGGRGGGGGGKESESEVVHDSQVTLQEGKCNANADADADAAADTDAAARAARANDVVNDLTEFLFDLFDAELDDG